jgi:hypothetical protein
VIAPHHRDEAIGEERPRAQLGRQLAVDPDRQVGRAVAQGHRIVGAVGHDPQIEARRVGRQPAIEGQPQHRQHVVRGPEHEPARQLARHEGPRRRQRRARLGHHRVDLRAQRLGPRGQHHAAPRAHQDRILEPNPDPGQRVAHRRRRQPHSPRRQRDRALLQQRVEGDQQAKVVGFHAARR